MDINNSMKIDLEFWLNMYDRASNELNDWYKDIEHITEYYGTPYSDYAIESLNNANVEIERLYYINQFIRKRILTYNR